MLRSLAVSHREAALAGPPALSSELPAPGAHPDFNWRGSCNTEHDNSQVTLWERFPCCLVYRLRREVIELRGVSIRIHVVEAQEVETTLSDQSPWPERI